jgi:hypothetical protein
MTHPITPPPELRSQWFNETPRADIYDYIIEKSAQWGADQELEACCEWLCANGCNSIASQLRSVRRPKPPSLKELALADLDEIGSHYIGPGTANRINTIRRALEALPND